MRPVPALAMLVLCTTALVCHAMQVAGDCGASRCATCCVRCAGAALPKPMCVHVGARVHLRVCVCGGVAALRSGSAGTREWEAAAGGALSGAGTG